MNRAANAARLFNLRALLIVGALALLCVSDGVGPRLLPLPTVNGSSSPLSVEFDQGPAARHTPSHGRTATRVEIISAPQRQAATERQAKQAVAYSPNFVLHPPHAARWRKGDFPPPAPESSARFSRPEGRAPPRRA